MTVSAVRPWRNALRHERSLPSGVVGPVLLSALRRLASICLRDVIVRSQQMGSFFHLGGHNAVWLGPALFPLPQSVFAIVINFQSGPWRHLQWVDAYRQPQTLAAFAPIALWQLAVHLFCESPPRPP